MKTINHKYWLFFLIIACNLSTKASIPTQVDHLMFDYSPAIPSFLSEEEKQPTAFAEQQKQNPSDYLALFNLATDYLKNRQFDEAIKIYQEAIRLNSSIAQIHYNLGIAYLKKEDFVQAESALGKAIMLNPRYSKAYLQLGITLQKQKKHDKAIESFTKALENDPNFVDAHLELARALSQQNKFDQSIYHFNEAIRARPQEMRINFEFANTLNMANKTKQALEIYLTLLQKNPDSPAINYNIAYTLKKLGRIQDAMPYYQAVLAKNPDHIEANFSLGLAYILEGDFERGFEGYEWRWKLSQQSVTVPKYPQPLWDGSELDGKTIFLYAEQGLGDTFQFIRYAQEAKKRGGHVVVAVQKPLVTIISCCKYIDKVVNLSDTPPHFDTHAPLMSLPYILKTRIDTVPNDIPYLYAKKELVQKWHTKLADDKQFKVGICWQGNSNYGTPFLRSVVAAKSIELNQLASISSVPGVSVYSLQKETGLDQLNAIANFNLKTFDSDFDQTNGRFMDTAAVMKNLDLVITIDTSIGHLAAGLGVPTWVLIPNPPDWRWMLDRTDTPWYPNMRLFRQKEYGDWDSAIEAITQELSKIQGHDIIETKTTKPLTASLEQELANIEIKLQDLGMRIRRSNNENYLDDQFIKNVRSFYLLNEVRTTIQEKQELL